METMRLVVRFTIETLRPLLRTQPFKPFLARVMALGRLDEAENRRYDSKKGERYDGRHVICKITHISELLVRRKGHAMGVSTDGNGRR